MLITDTINRLRGYVVVWADGYFLERFLNICMRRGIFLWNIRRIGDERIQACVSIDGFLQLRQIARKTRTHITLKRRCGMPFFLHRYRKRRTVLAGVLLFFGILWYLSSHVMGIDIVGNSRIPRETVIEELKGFGVYTGATIKKIDRRVVQNQMMTRLDDIAWIGVNIKGSRVYIEIKERLDTRRELDGDVPCNIVAAKDGVVRLMNVKAGQSVVGVNDMVEKGELLVSGAVDSTTWGIRYVHSFGEVYADTRYKKVREYPLEYTEKIYTGEKKQRYSVEAFGKKLKLFFNNRPPYEYCDKSTDTKEYRAASELLPSVFVHCDTYAAYVPERRQRSVEQAVVLGKEELCAELNGELPQGAEIKNTSVTYRTTGTNKVSVTVEYECSENIALQTPIDKIENMNYDIDKSENDTLNEEGL